MFASKPLASLSSGLLARKGQARPAMRPQGFASLAGIAAPLEDLGWNDMGSGEPAEPAPTAPAPIAAPSVAAAPEVPEQPAPMPPVLAQREALREGFETPEPAAEAVDVAPEPLPSPNPAPAPVLAATKSVSVATATRLARESAQQTRKGKAAFTLRLDGDRHLRLRLASALSGRSAQLLVTAAVDQMLGAMPEVETLVTQLPPRKTNG